MVHLSLCSQLPLQLQQAIPNSFSCGMCRVRRQKLLRVLHQELHVLQGVNAAVDGVQQYSHSSSLNSIEVHAPYLIRNSALNMTYTIPLPLQHQSTQALTLISTSAASRLLSVSFRNASNSCLECPAVPGCTSAILTGSILPARRTNCFISSKSSKTAETLLRSESSTSTSAIITTAVVMNRAQYLD